MMSTGLWGSSILACPSCRLPAPCPVLTCLGLLCVPFEGEQMHDPLSTLPILQFSCGEKPLCLAKSIACWRAVLTAFVFLSHFFFLVYSPREIWIIVVCLFQTHLLAIHHLNPQVGIWTLQWGLPQRQLWCGQQRISALGGGKAAWAGENLK